MLAVWLFCFSVVARLSFISTQHDVKLYRPNWVMLDTVIQGERRWCSKARNRSASLLPLLLLLLVGTILLGFGVWGSLVF